MLIKPIIKSTSEKGSISSLPSLTLDPYQIFLLPEGIEEREAIEIEGRLLILPLIFSEANLVMQKRNHEVLCGRWIVPRWPICECQFAENIREKDLEEIKC